MSIFGGYRRSEHQAPPSPPKPTRGLVTLSEEKLQEAEKAALEGLYANERLHIMDSAECEKKLDALLMNKQALNTAMGTIDYTALEPLIKAINKELLIRARTRSNAHLYITDNTYRDIGDAGIKLVIKLLEKRGLKCIVNDNLDLWIYFADENGNYPKVYYERLKDVR